MANESRSSVHLSVTQLFAAQPDVHVTGRVYDEESTAHLGIEAVQILLVAIRDTTVRVTAMTNRQGLYSIAALTPGRYRVRMFRTGYAAITWERNFQRTVDTLDVGLRPGNGADYRCPTDSVLEPSFSVIVRDQNARPVVQGVTVVARSGTNVDTLKQFMGNFGGVPQREGRYVLVATGPGFRPTSSEPFYVSKVKRADRLCGVQVPQSIFVERISG